MFLLTLRLSVLVLFASVGFFVGRSKTNSWIFLYKIKCIYLQHINCIFKYILSARQVYKSQTQNTLHQKQRHKLAQQLVHHMATGSAHVSGSYTDQRANMATSYSTSGYGHITSGNGPIPCRLIPGAHNVMMTLKHYSAPSWLISNYV